MVDEASTERGGSSNGASSEKDPAKVAAGRKGGISRASKQACKQEVKQDDEQGKQPDAGSKQDQADEAPIPRRREDLRPWRATVEREKAMPQIAVALRLLLRDHWVTTLDHAAFRVYLQLVADADEFGRVHDDAYEIIARALWSNPVFNRFDEREPPQITWPEIRKYLAELDLIELGESELYVYVAGLAPAAPPAGGAS